MQTQQAHSHSGLDACRENCGNSLTEQNDYDLAKDAIATSHALLASMAFTVSCVTSSRPMYESSHCVPTQGDVAETQAKEVSSDVPQDCVPWLLA